MLRLLQRAEKHFVVCGFGRVGKPVAEGLQDAGHTVCVIDGNPVVEPELEGAGFLYLIGDATDDEVLRLAGLERARALMALLPSDADNLYLTMTAKTVHPELTVIARANDSIFGLGSSIWTRDLDRATRAAQRLEAGYTWINSVTKIYDELPFGGFKQSGVGQEHGIEAIDHYMATKAVVVKQLD